MPTIPAYLSIALLPGPLLVTLWIADFTAHMFIFYFAVASANTPPVAVVMFVPPMSSPSIQLLLIPQAQLDPAPGSGQAFLAGYDGGIHPVSLIWLLARLAVALYPLASVLCGFGKVRGPSPDGRSRLSYPPSHVAPNVADTPAV